MQELTKNKQTLFIVQVKINSNLEKMRAGARREIDMMRLVLYVATAAAMAATAADYVANAMISALGNLGLLLIMVRLYVLTPVVIARTKDAENRWLEAEYRNVEENYPWANMTGKAGWAMLFLSVILQVTTGMA